MRLFDISLPAQKKLAKENLELSSLS